MAQSDMFKLAINIQQQSTAANYNLLRYIYKR